MDDLFVLQREFNLPRSLARLLVLLLETRNVTGYQIEFKHHVATDAKVAIHRLRRRLMPHNLSISSMREAGYWMEPDQKLRLRAIIASRECEDASHHNSEPTEAVQLLL